jgi:hypothetical protein
VGGLLHYPSTSSSIAFEGNVFEVNAWLKFRRERNTQKSGKSWTSIGKVVQAQDPHDPVDSRLQVRSLHMTLFLVAYSRTLSNAQHVSIVGGRKPPTSDYETPCGHNARAVVSLMVLSHNFLAQQELKAQHSGTSATVFGTSCTLQKDE